MSVKILHTSDWHVGRRIRGRDRSEEHRAVLAEISQIAETEEVDLTVIAGDIFDTGSPTPTSEQVVFEALRRLSSTAPIVVVAGNHDNPRRLDAIAPFLDMANITVVGAPVGPDRGGVVDLDGVDVKVGLLPFVSQRGIVRAVDLMGSDPDHHAARYEDRVKALVETLTAGMGGDTVNILVSHLTVHGADLGGGERRAHVFGYAVPTSVFPGHLSYVALGHLHRQQKMPHAGAVWYSGSPLQLDFGEEDDRKGVLVVKASPGRPSNVESIPLNAGKRLVVRRGSLDEVVAMGPVAEDEYVRVVLEEQSRVGLADEVRSAIGDVVEIALGAAEQTGAAPSPRRDMEPTAAFAAYLAERGVGDERIEALFAELLAEAMTS